MAIPTRGQFSQSHTPLRAGRSFARNGRRRFAKRCRKQQARADKETPDQTSARVGAGDSASIKPSAAEVETAFDFDLTAVRLARAANRIVIPLARVARSYRRLRAWREFGDRTSHDHCRERFGRSGRWLANLANLGDAFERFPEIASAMRGADGGKPLGKVAALEIAKVADEGSISTWIRLARSVTVNRLKKEVAAARERGSVVPVESVAADDALRGEGQPGAAGRGGAGASNRDDGAAEPEVEDDPDDAFRRLVRLLTPRPVQCAFDSDLLLHRAYVGHDSTVDTFVGDLVADAQSGRCPPDVDAIPLRRRPNPREIEERLARATDVWRHLGEPDGDDWIDAQSLDCLLRFEACARVAGEGGPRELLRQMRTLLELERELARRYGEVLVQMSERGAWSSLLFRGIGHYGEQRLGLSRTSVQTRARVVRSLRRFPLLRRAYREGALTLPVVDVLLRILGRGPVDAKVESAWIAHACRYSVKRLRQEAAAIKRDQSMGRLGGDPLPLDDAAWHRSLGMAPGTIYKRVAEAGLRAAAGKSPDTYLRLRLTHDTADRFLAAIDARCRDLTAKAESVPWDQPWPDDRAAPSILAARTFSIRCRRVPAWVGLLAMLEDFAATYDPIERPFKRNSDKIYSRDGWICRAPGCTARVTLEDHHLKHRARGGSNDLFNRTALCAFHHRQGEHGVLASVSGKAPLGMVWRLGRDGIGGTFLNEGRIRAGPAP